MSPTLEKEPEVAPVASAESAVWLAPAGRRVLDAMGDYFVALDRGLNIAFANRALAEATRARHGELVGRCVWDLWPHLRGTIVEASLEEAFTENRPIRFEYRDPRSEAWIVASAEPDGAHIGVYLREVGGRRRAEERLARSEALAQSVVRTVVEGVIVLDAKGEVLLTNDAFDRLHAGLESDPRHHLRDFEGWFELHELDGTPVPPERWPAARALRGERIERWDLHVRHSGTGGEFWGSYSAAPVRDANGQIESVVLSVADVTDRVRAEREAADALRASAERFRLLVESVPEIAWTARPDGYLDYFNERWYEYTGQPREADAPWTAFLHPDDRARAESVWNRSAASGEPYELELRMREAATGQYRWFLARARPLRDPEGGIVRWFGITSDIHEQKVREATLTLLAELAESTRPMADPHAIVAVAQRMLGEHLQASRCAYADVDLDAQTFTIVRDWSPELPSSVGTFPIAAFGERVPNRLLSGETLVVRDVAAELEGDPAAEALALLGVAAIVCVPLVKDGRLVAMLAVHQAEPRHWTLDDVELVATVADRCWDAVERARVERALSESAAQYRQIAEGLPQMVWSAGPDGVRDYFNERWHEYTGVGLREAENPWLEVLHPEDRERAVGAWWLSVDGGETFQAEYRLRAKDGRYRWFLGRAIPLRNEAGEIARWFGTCTDIDEQKSAQGYLEISNRFAQTLADDLDPQRIVQALTDAGTAAVGAEFGSFFYMTPEKEPSPEGEERFGLYTLSGAPKEAFAGFPSVRKTPLFTPTFGGEGVVRSEDVTQDPRFSGMPLGHLPVRSYLAVPVRSRSGEVLGGLLFGHSEPSRFNGEHQRLVESFAAQASVAYENAVLYERLRSLNEDLERRVEERTLDLTRANRDLNEFSYSVAHDLRAPLRAIVSTSQILLEDASDRLSESEQEILRRQALNGVRLAKIVDDLLGFARLAKADIRRQNLDFTALARRVADEVRARRPGGCNVDVQEGLKAYGDSSLLGYALTNLVDNACKFSRGEGVVTVGQRDGAFFVRDQGVGFDMTHAHKLFVAFERLVDQETFEGTGVGLANVKRIVERHGGRIWAESEPGKGATFWFTLEKGKGERV